jgi:hypothetical protein
MGKYNFASIEAVKLEKFRVDIKKVISETMWLGLNPTVDIVRDLISRDLILSFNTYIWSEQLQNETQMIYPKNIWQFFKQEYFPQWLKNKFPVKYTNLKVVFERRAIFPKFMKASPDYSIIEHIYVTEEDN